MIIKFRINLKSFRTSVFILLLIFYGSFLLFQMNLPAADDLPRQIRNGMDIVNGDFDILYKNVYSYIEPNQPFANHHWGSGVIFYLTYQVFGYNGMSILKVVIMLATFSLLFYVATRKANFWLVTILSIPTIFILAGRSGLRPEMFSYLFIALYLYLLDDLQEHPEHKRIFWLIPIQLAWTSIHIFFVFGILMVCGVLFEKIVLALTIRREGIKSLKNDILVRKLALLLVCLILVIFINPIGLNNEFTGFRLSSTKDSPVSSAETVSVGNILRYEPRFANVSASIFIPLVILSLLSFVIGFWRKPIRPILERFSLIESLNSKTQDESAGKDYLPIFYFFAVAGTSVLGYLVLRSLPLFGLMFLPAISTNFNGLFVGARDWLKVRWPEVAISLKYILPVTIILFLSYYVIFVQDIFHNSRIGITSQSESSARFFKEHGLRGPIFNDTDIGSYLIGYLYPREKVFVDNRFRDAYSAEFFRNTYLPMIQDDEKWKVESDKEDFNVVFLYLYNNVDGSRNFIKNRMHDYVWPLVYADRYALIFVKRTAENKKVIDEFEITSDNAVEKLRHLLESDDSDEMIAGADLLFLLGRIDLAMFNYMKAVSMWPERGKVWMVMGRTELMKPDQENSNPALALLFLQQAIGQGWENWEAYSYLALAYFRLGQIDKAREAVNKELSLDPESEDGKKWLKTLNDLDAVE